MKKIITPANFQEMTAEEQVAYRKKMSRKIATVMIVRFAASLAVTAAALYAVKKLDERLDDQPDIEE